jgi:flagellar biosynthesis/type III secretory pathway ATPase
MPKVDAALAALDPITAFLRQGRDERSVRAETLRRLAALVTPGEKA